MKKYQIYKLKEDLELASLFDDNKRYIEKAGSLFIVGDNCANFIKSNNSVSLNDHIKNISEVYCEEPEDGLATYLFIHLKNYLPQFEEIMEDYEIEDSTVIDEMSYWLNDLM